MSHEIWTVTTTSGSDILRLVLDFEIHSAL